MENVTNVLRNIIDRINSWKESDTYEDYDNYFRAGVDAGLEDAIDIIADVIADYSED